MKLWAAIAAKITSRERAAAHAKPHLFALKIQAEMVFKFSADIQVVLFPARRAQNGIAVYLRPAMSRGAARNHADKQNEVAGGAGMKTSPALPLRIETEMSAHEKAPWRSDGGDSEAEHQRDNNGDNDPQQAAAGTFVRSGIVCRRRGHL